jgi:hypothetical protein
MCYRGGCVHSALVEGKVIYAFPSLLHAAYVSWRLLPSSFESHFKTPRDRLSQFRSLQLASPARIGVAFTDRPPEAQYQDEFYRGLLAATGSGTQISPEFLSAPGARLGPSTSLFQQKNDGGQRLRETGVGWESMTPALAFGCIWCLADLKWHD